MMFYEGNIENGILTIGWNYLIKVGSNEMSTLFRLKIERGFSQIKLILTDSLYGFNMDINGFKIDFVN